MEENIESCDSESKLAYLSFDLFNWMDRNLKQSSRYQDRQIYIDIISILTKFLFQDSFGWHQSSPNHFIVDLHDLCNSLIDTKCLTYRFSTKLPSLKDLHSSQFFMMLIIQRYRLLHIFTELSTKDRVNTIRASACTVLYSLLKCINFWVVNNIHCLTEIERPDDNCIEAIMDYYDCYIENTEDNSANTCFNGFNSEHLYRRLHSETDRIVTEELNKVFQLVDDYRLDFNINYYQLKNKRKKQRKRENDCLLPEVAPEIIDSSVIELVDELLLFVENMNIDIDIFGGDNGNTDNIHEIGIDFEDTTIHQELINIDNLDEPHIPSLLPSPSTQQLDNNRRGLIFIPNVELGQFNTNIQSENSGTIPKQSLSPSNTAIINHGPLILSSSISSTSSTSISSTNKSPMKRKSSKHTNSNSHAYSSNQFSKASNNSNNNSNSSKSLVSKLNNKSKNLHHKHWPTASDTANSSNASHYRSNQQQSMTSNLKTKTKHKESQQQIHSNKTGNVHHSNNSATSGSGTMKPNSQRNVALLPTPVLPSSNNRHHYQYRNSKVPVYSNHNSNNSTGSVNYLPTPTTSVSSSGSGAPTPYSGMCFRIVYPSLLSSAQFYTTPGVNPVLTSQPQQSNYTTHSGPQLLHPNHSQQHYHHHGQHVTGTNFSNQSKLPKTPIVPTSSLTFHRAQMPNTTNSLATNLPLPSKFKHSVQFNHSKYINIKLLFEN